MSRLVVASNRVADLEAGARSGGLAVALGDALAEGQGLWFGWDGTVIEDDRSAQVSIAEQRGVTKATIALTRREHDTYYLGYSNKLLWPAFHYRLDLTEIAPRFLDGYRRVNRRLAGALVPLLRPDDLIWIHDYHLIPMGAELRSHGIVHPMGFFLHIPFPSPDILLAVPGHDWLVRTLFSYDVVGFQTRSDVAQFARYVEEHAGGRRLSRDRLEAFGRSIVTREFPIGIDVAAFHATAHAPAADAHIARLERRSMAGVHIIGVDRLDYTKGLPERLKAFRRLLELYPENRKAVTFMQIAPPTREEVYAYAEIRQELEGLTGAINGEFGDYDWTPVRYVHRIVPRETLAALYRGSKVGFVTPFRDGMNLVAKEYIAAQDADDPGVLVLSRFAGAAEELDQALIVNPYDVDEMTAALQHALTMRKYERRDRHRALMKRIMQNDVNAWRESFLAALRGCGDRRQGGMNAN